MKKKLNSKKRKREKLKNVKPFTKSKKIENEEKKQESKKQSLTHIILKEMKENDPRSFEVLNDQVPRQKRKIVDIRVSSVSLQNQ